MNGAMLGHLAGRHGKHRVHGWIISAVVHMCGVGAAFSWMTDLQLTPQPEPFRWEVSLQEPVSPMPEEQPDPTPAPPVPKNVEPRRVEKLESLHETGDPIVRQVQASPLAENRTVPSPMATPTVMASSEDVVTQHIQAVATPQAHIVQDAENTYDVVPTAHAAPLIQHVPIRERVLRAFPQTQADYGWLRDSVLARIQQLKRYPSRAKMNDWEGKIIVQAVICEDGSIVDLMVAESSGHEALDQDALLMVKSASPLTLKHPLGKAQVPILVPISYRLDG